MAGVATESAAGLLSARGAASYGLDAHEDIDYDAEAIKDAFLKSDALFLALTQDDQYSRLTLPNQLLKPLLEVRQDP